MQKEIYRDRPTVSWVLDHCKILHLGLVNSDGTFVVPVHYDYEVNSEGKYVIYIHGTSNGNKGKALNKKPVISFEADGGHENLIYTPPAEGAFGPAFRSVMGRGQVEIIEDNDEKLHALRSIIHNYVLDIPVALHAEKMAKVPVWKIIVDDITAKIHHPTAEWQTALGISAPISKGIHYDENGTVKSIDKIEIDESIDANTSASKHLEN